MILIRKECLPGFLVELYGIGVDSVPGIGVGSGKSAVSGGGGAIKRGSLESNRNLEIPLDGGGAKAAATRADDAT